MIRTEGVSKSFGGLQVLRDVHCEISTGECVAVIGPSGTGKSVFLSLLNGLNRPDEGRVFIGENELTAKGADLNRIRRKMGMVYQNFNLFSHLTVMENITLGPRKLNKLPRAAAEEKALGLLQTAASAESASQETIDSAMSAIAAMANWSMLETQLENTLIAKDFSDCVVYISGDGVTVAVPAPAEGLSEAAVARITEAVTTGTDFTADQLRLIELKPSGTGTTDAGTAPETDDGSSSADQGGSEGTTDAGSGSGEDTDTLLPESDALAESGGETLAP